MARRLAAYALLLVLVVGCTRARKRAGDLLHSSAISRVELIERNPTKSALLAAARVSSPPVPEGALPPGYAPAWVLASAKYTAVAAEQSRVSSCWLFDRQWRSLGQVVGIPPAEDGQGRWLKGAWSPGGETLAVAVETNRENGGHWEIGVVDPSTRRVDALLRLGDSFDLLIAWAQRRLLVAYGAITAATNVVMEVDPLSRRSRLVYAEPRGPRDIRVMLAWPYGRYLAFMRSPPKAGIWLLDLRTGKCEEAVRSSASDYYYEPLRWEAPDRLLFSDLGGHQPAIYRAYVGPPGSAGATP